MYIVAGLGNPGSNYEHTRHNVGFKTIDILASQLAIEVSKKKFKALVGEGNLDGKKVVLLKPQTFMNLSGESIYEAINWYKIPLANLIIIYDDIDLPVGKLRIRAKGSAGTHNGMKSIVEYLDDEDFPRVRIGVGKPVLKDLNLANFVLSKFLEEEKPEIELSLRNSADAVKDIIQSGINVAMKKFN